jgi:hypothetical protein
MRLSPALGACLGLTLACARPPSAIPLGGKEWVAAERHVDRRAPSGESETETPRAAQKSGSSVATTTSIAAPPVAPVASTVPLETTLGLVPLVAGTTVTLRTKYTVRATLITGTEEGGGTQAVEADAAERIVVRVVRADADDVREVELEYVESKATFRLEGTPPEEDSNFGKRYAVVFDGGDGRVSKRSGSLEPGEDRAVLFDLATVTGYWPLLKPHLPRSLAPGFRSKLQSKDVARVFGSPEDVQFEGSELTLRGRAVGEGAVAVFDARLPARFEKDGIALRVDLAGTVNVRASDARPLEVSLRGELAAEQGALGSGASLSGTVAVELSHEYSAVK